MRLELLRGFSLSCAEEQIELCSSAQRVVAFLALAQRSLRRGFVAGTLWPDSSDARAGAALRTALWRAGATSLQLVESRGDAISLASTVAVDAHELATIAQQTLRDPASCQPAAAERLSSPADLLPDSYEDWVVVEREWLRQLRLQALEALALAQIDQHRYQAAVRTGLAAVAIDALRESAHRVVVRAHLEEGNRGDALRQYRLCERLVRRSLGITPSPAMETLIAPVRGG